MTCPACAASARFPQSGAYDLRCVKCCARLVVSAYPERIHGDSMREVVKRAIIRHRLEFRAADVQAEVDKLLKGKS